MSPGKAHVAIAQVTRVLEKSAGEVATRLVLSAPQTVPNEFPHAASPTGVAALSGELLAPLDLSLERWLAHEASPAFLTTNRH